MAQSKISVLIDVAVDGANRSLKSFRQSISDAEGATGKLKAGAAGAFDQIKANAGNLALAAGASLVAFGVKSVAAFQDVALEAGKMSDALGLTAEEASRYIEVAGDVGVSTDSITNSIGRMNIAAAKTPAAFADIGAELVKNADGTTNVNETFLSTVDALNRIPDATQRAAAAQKIFGKGWKDMAELIGLGADGIRKSLDSVEGGKVIDDKEVARARQFRDSLDALKGVSEELGIVVGGALVPALTDAADALMAVKDVAENVGEVMPDMPGWFDSIADAAGKTLNPVKGFIDTINDASDAFGSNSDAADRVAESVKAGISPTEESTAATDEAAEAAEGAAMWQNALAESLDNAREAQEAATEAVMEGINSDLNYRNQVAQTAATLNESNMVQADATRTTEEHAQAARDAEGAVLAQASAAVALAEDQAAANGATLTAEDKTRVYKEELERLAGFLTGPTLNAINGHIAALNGIPRSIATDIGVRSSSGYRGSKGGGLDGNPFTALAEGGIVKARPGGIIANIGEGGHDEAVIPLSGPNAPNLGGSSPIYLTVNAGLGVNGSQVGRQIVDVLEAHYRSGGRPPRSG